MVRILILYKKVIYSTPFQLQIYFWIIEINKEMIKNLMPSKDNFGSMLFVCGPTNMYKHVCGDKNPDKSQGKLSGLLKELGYSEDNVYKF